MLLLMLKPVLQSPGNPRLVRILHGAEQDMPGVYAQVLVAPHPLHQLWHQGNADPTEHLGAFTLFQVS